MKMSFVLLILCISLLVALLHAQNNSDLGFISIDCGAPNAYKDDKLLIQYETDEGFVLSGVNKQVATNYASQMPQLTNLRSFPHGERNCYTLRPKQGSSRRYLIRASFYYGNYDLRSQSPKFDLHIDVNYWTTVDNSANYTYREVIYTTRRDYIHVCLVNTGLGVPFISVLELRTLKDSIYNVTSGALNLDERSNMGSFDTYRYPYDIYDRIWEGRVYGWSRITNKTNVDDLGKYNDAYNVPIEVLMTAHQSRKRSYGMEIYWSTSNSSDKWHVFLHFAEIQKLQQVRQLDVYVNENTFVSTVTPTYLKPVTVATMPFSGSVVNFSVYSDSKSNLSAFFNAVEYFIAIDLPNSHSDLNDVNAINDIRREYAVFGDVWHGDPCVPQQFTWKGLTCSQDKFPKITSLNMSSSRLNGTISASFSNLTALVFLDLSFNELNGPLPESLASLRNLRVLNLSYNNFSGSIPEALRMKNLTDNEFILRLDGNPNLCISCASPPSQSNNGADKKQNTTLSIIVGVASGFFVIIALCIIGGVCIMRKRKQGGRIAQGTHVSDEAITKPSDRVISSKDEGTRGFVNKHMPFTFAEVSVIADNFKVILGEGGLGNVYLGTLEEGTKVAVKVLSPLSKQGHKNFRVEAEHLMITRHKNLVSLVGYCDEHQNMSLVYEYMSNGNLRQHLSGHAANVLSWSKRLQIGVDAAQGLEYLHNDCRPPIVHRDLKSSNILLNDKMQAKISDFGLSRFFVADEDSHISTRPAVNLGYLDPMFHASGKLDKKSDVYSFGIILLELITGNPTIIRDQKGSTHIVQWVTPLIEKGDAKSIVDPRIHGQFDTDSAWKTIETAMQCVQLTPIQRPDISRILSDLKECLAIQTRYMLHQAMESSDLRSGSFEITSLEVSVPPRSR